MKTNTFYLSLILFLSIFAFGNAQDLNTFNGCIVDQDGEELIYADILFNDTIIVQTDLDGCYHFESWQKAVFATISYPGYLQKKQRILSDESPTIVLNYWQGKASSELASDRKLIEIESSGDFLYNGIVLSDGKEPLIGVSIQIEDTPYGTITDIDGRFKLYASKKCSSLNFSYTGFEKKKTRLCSGEELEVVMTEAGMVLESVMVTALGISKKRSAMESEASPVALSYDMASSSPPPPPPPPPAPAVDEIFITKSRERPEDMRPMTREEKFMRKISPDEDAFIEKDRDDEMEELPNAGQLTAGEVNDFSKWDMWADISQEDLAEHRNTWKQFADHRYTLQLTTPDGLPVVNASVQLNDGQGNVLWRTRTNNTGQAEMWAHYFLETKRAANGLSISGTVGRNSFEIPNAKPFKDGINFYKIKTVCIEQPIIDIAFVIDATGSMGDEITYLQAELLNVIARINDSLPDADVQSGSIFYKDKTDDYITKINDFDKDAAVTVQFIQEQRAGGGGDFPEAVDDAMEAAIDELAWRNEATTRLLFLVLDAPPHENEDNIKRMQVAVTKAAEKGIQIIPVACSGINKSTEFLMRSMALATNGTYTFITDHSGIGNAHIEPSTDDYTVEFLNDVLVRLSVDRSRLQSCDDKIIAEIDKKPFKINGGAEGEKWSYYPNPTTGPLNFRFENSDGMLYLYDGNGKLLERTQANKRLELNLGDYPAGTYWLKHEDVNGNWTQGQVFLIRR